MFRPVIVALIVMAAFFAAAASAEGFAVGTPDRASGLPRAAGHDDVRAAHSRSALAQRNTHARPDFAYYMTKSDALDEVRAIVDANPRTMRLDAVTAEQDGYVSELLVVTVEPNGLDTPPERGREKTRVLYNYGEHGRELITVQVAVQLLRELAKGVQHASTLSHETIGQAATAAALVDAIVKIVPMENTNGRTKVEGGEWCERKNGRGVDTNRNWAVDWGVKEADFDPYEEYPGAKPFSEPEARMLRSLVEEFKPHAWVNVHSGMEAMFMPYDHKASEPKGEGAQAMRSILRDLNRFHCGGRCATGGGGKGVGYLAHGTATDWVYVKGAVPVAFTWEIYGDTNAHYMDCFRMFNPIGKDKHDAVVRDWVAAGVSVLPMLARHPDLPAHASAGSGGIGGAGGGSGGSGSVTVERDDGDGEEEEEEDEPAGRFEVPDDSTDDSDDSDEEEDGDGAGTPGGAKLRGDASRDRLVQRSAAVIRGGGGIRTRGSGTHATTLGTRGLIHLTDGIDEAPARMDKIRALQRLGGLKVDGYGSGGREGDDWSTNAVRVGGYSLAAAFACCVILPRWRRTRFLRRGSSKGGSRRSPK